MLMALTSTPRMLTRPCSDLPRCTFFATVLPYLADHCPLTRTTWRRGFGTSPGSACSLVVAAQTNSRARGRQPPSTFSCSCNTLEAPPLSLSSSKIYASGRCSNAGVASALVQYSRSLPNDNKGSPCTGGKRESTEQRVPYAAAGLKAWFVTRWEPAPVHRILEGTVLTGQVYLPTRPWV